MLRFMCSLICFFAYQADLTAVDPPESDASKQVSQDTDARLGSLEEKPVTVKSIMNALQKFQTSSTAAVKKEKTSARKEAVKAEQLAKYTRLVESFDGKKIALLCSVKDVKNVKGTLCVVANPPKELMPYVAKPGNITAKLLVIPIDESDEPLFKIGDKLQVIGVADTYSTFAIVFDETPENKSARDRILLTVENGEYGFVLSLADYDIVRKPLQND